MSRDHLLCIRGNHDNWAAHASSASRWDRPSEVIGQHLREAIAAWPGPARRDHRRDGVIFVHYHMTRPTERTSPSFSTEGPAFDAQFQPHAEAICLGHDHSTLDASRGRRYVNPGALGTDPQQ